jgi:uncharacterized protein
MKINQRFMVAQPAERVWYLLSNVPAVAVCIPGLELTEHQDDGTCKGRFALKVGPLSAKLDGVGIFLRDNKSRSATVEGKGVDKRGGSRVSASMRYVVIDGGDASTVEVEADIKLSGPLAQVGRTGIIEDVAQTLTNEFAANIEQRLVSEPAETPEVSEGATVKDDEIVVVQPSEFDAGSAISKSLWRRITLFFKRLFGMARDE